MQNLIGEKFGMLTVVGISKTKKARKAWECLCVCGNISHVMTASLNNGNTKSCGCLKKYRLAEYLKKNIHGMSKTKEYSAWASIKQRCLNKNNNRFRDYGGRGITVCDDWKNSFTNFFIDMGTAPSKEHSIDRINNNGNYEKKNCRWATRSQQQLNKKKGNTDNLSRGDSHWTRKDRKRAKEIAVINIANAHKKGELNKNAKLSMEKANKIRDYYALNKGKTLVEIGKVFGLGKETVRKVIRRLAWS